MFTDDPIADFNRHDAEQQRWLDSRPKCAECGEPIQDDHYFDINDEPVCEECLNFNYRKHTEDFIS